MVLKKKRDEEGTSTSFLFDFFGVVIIVVIQGGWGSRKGSGICFLFLGEHFLELSSVFGHDYSQHHVKYSSFVDFPSVSVSHFPSPSRPVHTSDELEFVPNWN